MPKRDWQRQCAEIVAGIATTCAVLFIPATVIAQSTGRVPEIVGLPDVAEFPEIDRGSYWFLRAGRVKEIATGRLQAGAIDLLTLRLLGEARLTRDFVRVLRAIGDNDPTQIPIALQVTASFLNELLSDGGRGYEDALREAVASIWPKVEGLARDDVARATKAKLQIERAVSGEQRSDWRAVRSSFIAEYKGTQEAELTEIEVLTEDLSTAGPMQDLEPLDAVVRRHPRTVIAAKALYSKAVRLANPRYSTKGTDPTRRWLEVLAIVNELETGGYPPNEWLDFARGTAMHFSTYQAEFEPANLKMLVDALVRYARSHLAEELGSSTTSGLEYLLTARLPELLTAVEGPEAAGRIFDALEADAPLSLHARLLRALWYLRRMQKSPEGPQRRADYERATLAFTAVAAAGNTPISRRALATLGTMAFTEGDFRQARNALRQFVAQHPKAGWSWIAALRLGQSEAELGDLDAALRAFELSAVEHPSVSPAVVLGRTLAARAQEALGIIDAAYDSYRLALAAWNPLYGDHYWWAVPGQGGRTPSNPELFENLLRKTELLARVEQLASSLRSSGGNRLERGRWLVSHGRRAEGVKLLEELVRNAPTSSEAEDARGLIFRAKLDAALELADVEAPAPDPKRAAEELERLGREASGFAGAAAMIAHGILLRRMGSASEGDSPMHAGFKAWQSSQNRMLEERPMSPLEADVIQIRNLLFRPSGDGFIQLAEWRGLRRNQERRPFVIARTRIPVAYDGDQVNVDVVRAIPGMTNVLWMDEEAERILQDMMAKLGGIQHHPRQQEVMQALNRFVPMLPGHWGGWMFATFPTVTHIEFLNTERTRATARFTVEYEGATVILEKVNGRWVAVRMVDRWIT